MKSTVTRWLLAFVVLAVTVPAVAQVTEDDIARARREMQRVMAEAEELDEQVQAAWARQVELEYEVGRLEEAIAHATTQLADARDRLEDVSVEMYMAAASGQGVGMVLNVDQSTFQAGLEYLRMVNGSGRELVNQLTVLSTELERLSARKAEASVEQAEVAEKLEAMSAELLEKLSAAQVQYDNLVAAKRRQDEEEQRRREEEARLAAAAATSTTRATTTSTAPAQTTTSAAAATTTTASPGTTSPPTTTPPTPTGGTCPVAGPVSFSNSWGAPREGGARAHQGVDMIAPRGTPIVAIYSGRIDRMSYGPRQGNAIWLVVDNGDKFFYAHLDGYADISVGQRVEEGAVIGFNGSTGNSPPNLPHLHFEWHPKGSGPVNPYPLVRSLC
ncbi:MAG TPA: peptidoglycan DD-metalloendopeptidase family protein [Acidimicrobiia bacterium]|nr:peptidoglycan DD-metalloendopeptidase family protein [Acidimicrobiia bacterium]